MDVDDRIDGAEIPVERDRVADVGELLADRGDRDQVPEDPPETPAGAPRAAGSCTRLVSTPCGSNPGSKFSNATKLRLRSAALTSSTTATAVATIRTRCQRGC